ncbi:hypothetical protein HYV72_01850 [Candidatus Uhrbacteria bacterium]|nr:hypothetical protein [Candidatus Uhrbacteria bacterium]
MKSDAFGPPARYFAQFQRPADPIVGFRKTPWGFEITSIDLDATVKKQLFLPPEIVNVRDSLVELPLNRLGVKAVVVATTTPNMMKGYYFTTALRLQSGLIMYFVMHPESGMLHLGTTTAPIVLNRSRSVHALDVPPIHGDYITTPELIRRATWIVLDPDLVTWLASFSNT